MAQNNWRHPANTQVAQVWSGDVTTTTNGHTYTVTLTDDDGNTEAITYTLGAGETTTTAAAGFVTAWNASYVPIIAGITASSSTNTITLTADTAGVPFSAATSGTGTWANDANTTENVGNNDYNQASNWDEDAVPTTNDAVNFTEGQVDVLYGLNQSSAAIGDFIVTQDCGSKFGRFEGGNAHYLRIDPNAFQYKGSGRQAMFDIGSANISCVIQASGSASSSSQKHTVYFKGSNVADLEILRGDVGVAPEEDDTATVAELIVGFVDNKSGDSNVTVGDGVTLTTLTQDGGKCLLKCAATTANVYSEAELTTEGTGAITTLNAYPSSSCVLKSSGTITTVNVWGTVDTSRDRTAKTLTTVNAKPGGVLIVNSDTTIGTLNGLTEPGTFTIIYV